MLFYNRLTKAALLLTALLFTAPYAASPFFSAERSRNLRTLETTPLLFEYHRETVSGSEQVFYYPQRDTGFRKGFAQSEKRALLGYQDEKQAIAASLVGGIDYRGGERLGDTIWPGIDGGIYLRGYRDSVEFMLDARIYMENHSADYPKSFDGEFVEFQKEENNSGVEYASYARYRGMFAINMGFGRLMLARDVFHFGPGYFNNLTLNQFALPYNTLSFEFHVGPLSVISLYGDLRIYKNSMSRKNTNDRNLYAHRYELNLGNLVLGMSETQILYNENKPWLFVPIVPLFMEKGNFSEDNNNGALAFDANYRLFQLARIYSEFYIDDFESPVSLVKNDNIEAKWAWMAGAQIGKNFYIQNKLIEAGAIAEYARVEPYVYSHFHPNTAQAANLGEPLGAPNGPNSQAIDFALYARLANRLNINIRNSWIWKGTDYGSGINDSTPTSNHFKLPKKFLDGADMKYSLSPAISYSGDYFFYSLELTLFHDEKIYTRLGFKW